MSDADLKDADQALRQVPVDNTWDEYSSQQWVLDALDSLHNMNFFPDDQYNQSYDVLLQYHLEGEEGN